ESVGGQPTLGFRLDIASIAKGCGYAHVLTASDKEGLSCALEKLSGLSGPVLLEIKVRIDSRDDLGRPTTTPVENKEHFMAFLKDTHS
ncbi:phosphonopyruvate decarboxylase, partial [Bacteroides fragilis]|nr:phosphonopyruvate decarboxylase [Bacteroides fragilis]